MSQTVRTIVGIVWLFAFLPAVADASPCAVPNAIQLIGRDIAGLTSVTFYPVSNSHDSLRWAFVSSEGPPDGATFVVSCDGKPIASVGTGFFGHVRQGPIINRRDTIELDVVSGSGTGISVHSVVLLQFDGRKILQLWTHVSDDKWSEPLESRVEEGEIAFRWQYNDAGTKILVHGKDTETVIPRGRPTTTRSKVTQGIFCLRGAAFIKCR